MDPVGLQKLSAAPIEIERREATARDVVENWLGSLTKSTKAAYKADLHTFATYLGCQESEAPFLLLGGTGGQANALVLGWLRQMTEEGLSTATRARRLSTLRSLVRMARRLDVVTWVLDVTAPRVQRYKDTAGPGSAAVRKLFAACGDDLEGKRNRVILMLLLGLGLRRFEVTGLKVGDLDRKRRKLRVLGKGNQEELLTVHPKLLAAIESWLEAAAIADLDSPLIRAVKKSRREHIVCTNSEPLSLRGLNHVVSKLGERAGIKVWPHALRHTGITRSLDLADGDVRKAQRFSRHRDVRTLLIYDDSRQDFQGELSGMLFEDEELFSD